MKSNAGFAIEVSGSQVSWMEYRGKDYPISELFLVIATKNADGDWTLCERSSWECEWFDVPTAQRSRVLDIATSALAEVPQNS